MNISLPEQLKNWAEAQAESGLYSNTSDYVRDLIRRDQIRAEKIAHMQALVAKSRASGISTETMDQIWERAQKMVAETKA